MEESSTYQLVIEKGRKKEIKDTLLHLGTRRFGPPPGPITGNLAATDDLDRLDRMRDRLLDAADWDDLLATP